MIPVQLDHDFIIKRPVTVELIESLMESVRYCRLSHCQVFLEGMGLSKLITELGDGTSVTLEDIQEQEGYDSLASHVGPIYFYGGPQCTGVQSYNLIKGNVLEWIMDTILYEYVAVDQHVFESLGIPI